MWTVWLGLYGVAGIDPFVKSGIPDLNSNIGHQVFAVKICCTQTPGARPFVLLQLAPTPINGKAQRLAFGGLMATESIGERILCALLLPCQVVVEPVTGIVTLVAPHCFLPQQPPAPPPPILVHRSPNKATSPSLFMSIKDGSCWSPHLRLTSRATSCGFSPPCGRGTGFARCLLLQHWAGCGCALCAPPSHHCALCTVRARLCADQDGREKLPSRKEKASEGKLDAARYCRKSNSPAQLCKKRFVEESHPVIRPLSVSFLFRTSGKEYHSQAGYCDWLKLSPRNDIKSDNMFKHIHIQ